jgi:DNA mismatch repair protein MutL
MFFYVNGRQVHDPLIHRAVMEGYATRVPRGRYPLAALFVSLDPGTLDVNVHPTKRRVRFRTTGDVFAAVLAAVAGGLSALDKGRWSPERPVEARERAGPGLSQPALMEELPSGALWTRADEPRETEQSPGFFSSLNPLGQVGASYIVAEAQDSLIIIDQHAAHERLIYEELKLDEAMPSQGLTEPLVLDLDPREAEALEGALDALSALGFDIEPFGERSVIVRGLPHAIDPAEAAAFLQASLTRAAETSGPPGGEELFAEFRSSLACRAALKAKRRLTMEEMRALLRSLDTIDVASSCPHGRPLWRRIGPRELAALFGRKGPPR